MTDKKTKWVALLDNGTALDGDVCKFADIPRKRVAAFAIVTDDSAVFIMENNCPEIYRRRTQYTLADGHVILEVMHFLGMKDRIVGVAPNGEWRELPSFSFDDWWSQPIDPANPTEREWIKRMQEPRLIIA